MTIWRSRIVDRQEVDPHLLRPHLLNPRRHPAAQLQALAAALSQIGWLQDVVVNRTTDRMLDGHARVEQALATNQPTVPVKYVDLSEAEELLALATFDPLGAVAEIDHEATNRLLAEIQRTNAEVTPGLVKFLATLSSKPEVEYPEPGLDATTFMLLIECVDEQTQAALLERLTEEGLQCRALLS